MDLKLIEMNLRKTVFFIIVPIIFASCASGYQMINPKSLSYNSNDELNGISLDYKYDLLTKKYAKKESSKGVKLVAIRITNFSENDVVLGKDLKLTYEDGKELYIMDNAQVFKSLRQNSATYLFYLLLTPLNLYTTNSSGQQTSSTPIGLIIGPGIAGGNMIASGSANKKFKTELMKFDIIGSTIKKGETKIGLIGIRSDNYDAIKLKLK